MIQLVGISGKKGTGKTLLGGILKYHGFKIFNFADSLKGWTQQLLNVGIEYTDGEHKESKVERLNNLSVRDFMIDFGQLMRKFSADGMFWVNKLYDRQLASLPDNSLVVIPDVRFPNEADFIRDKGGIIVRLERSLELNIYKTEGTDASEVSLDNYNFDVLCPALKNKTPQDLEKLAYEITKLAKEKLLNVSRIGK